MLTHSSGSHKYNQVNQVEQFSDKRLNVRTDTMTITSILMIDAQSLKVILPPGSCFSGSIFPSFVYFVWSILPNVEILQPKWSENIFWGLPGIFLSFTVHFFQFCIFFRVLSFFGFFWILSIFLDFPTKMKWGPFFRSHQYFPDFWNIFRYFF